jgi:hypothetical protein
MMVQPNYDFRSSSTNPAEMKAVRDAFARSVLWGFSVAAESDGGRRVLVDMSDFLIRDAANIAPSLTPGSYRLDNTRSAIYMPMTMNFPKNTEMEAELTFISQPGGAAVVVAEAVARSLKVWGASLPRVKRPVSACTPRSWSCRTRISRAARTTRDPASAAEAGSTTRRRWSSRCCSAPSRVTGWKR